MINIHIKIPKFFYFKFTQYTIQQFHRISVQQTTEIGLPQT